MDLSVKIEREVNVPFLIITVKLNDIILSFNTLKYLVQSRNDIESIVILFQMSLLMQERLFILIAAQMWV